MQDVASPQAIEQRVFEILETFGAVQDAIRRDATFEQLDIDSLDLVELAQIVDEEYDVQVTIDDAAELTNVGDAIDLIASRVS